jgi:hypothetical protein
MFTPQVAVQVDFTIQPLHDQCFVLSIQVLQLSDLAVDLALTAVVVAGEVLLKTQMRVRVLQVEVIK